MIAIKCSPVTARAVNSRQRAVRCLATADKQQGPKIQYVVAAGITAAVANLLAAQMAMAAFKLPPIDNDPNRCDRGYVGNTIGQANAVSDKLLDLRQCNFKGANLSGKTLSGALMSEADLSDTNMQEAVLTKAYARKASFENADMTNAVVDRVDFTDANLRKVKFNNAVVTGATFNGADLTESIWEEALIGQQDVGKLCENPTLVGDSRLQVGCKAIKSAAPKSR